MASEMKLRIHGMDCAEEFPLLKRELLSVVKNNKRLGFDVLNGNLDVDLSGADVTEGDVLAAIERTGLRSERWRDRSRRPTINRSGSSINDQS